MTALPDETEVSCGGVEEFPSFAHEDTACAVSVWPEESGDIPEE
jgi:hypothetical protein